MIKTPRIPAAGLALHAAATLRIAQWDARARDPEPVQRRTLAALCAATANTAYGIAHQLGRCRRYEDFRSAVPVREYADFLPWLEPMRAGSRDVLWPGFVPFFALSGGSTRGPGGLKSLPVSTAQLRWQTRAAFDAIARYLVLSNDRALTSGFALGLVPPVVIKREGAVGVSSNPALLMHHAPLLSRAFSLPQQPVAAVEDFESRLHAIADAYVDHDVRLLAGTPCWFSVLFDKLLDVARRRGRHVSTVRELWPNLRGLITGGSSPTPYRSLFAQQLGTDVEHVDHYNSTEAGLVACADRRGSDDLLMVPDRGVFYEFVARADWGTSRARRVPLWEVETGRDYAVIVSTPSGLLGYSLGDVVRFTSCFPHRLEILGRLHGGLSPAHEVTSESMLEAAVAAASQRTHATPAEFTSAADDPAAANGKSRYRVWVEFARPPTSLEAFRDALDAELIKQNVLYGMVRANDVVLLAPLVVSLPRGSTERFMRALGPRSVQQKFPRTLDAARRAILESGLAS